MRMTRIVYAFRNKVWPKPMEGLDLFTPTVKADASSSESSEEEDINIEGAEVDSNMEFSLSPSPLREKRPRRAKFDTGNYDEDMDIDGEDGVRDEMRDFEIEKSHGLKLTLKKSMQLVRKESPQEQEDPRVKSFYVWLLCRIQACSCHRGKGGNSFSVGGVMSST